MCRKDEATHHIFNRKCGFTIMETECISQGTCI
jgi:hypothetical protein